MILRSIKVTSPGLKDKIINNLIWAIANIIVFVYVMPTFGLQATFGTFITFSVPIFLLFLTAINLMFDMLWDVVNLSGSALQYELTLPIPPSMVFVKYALEYMYQTIITILPIVPVAKLLLWNHISFQYFSFFKFSLLIITATIFSGFFTLFIISIIKSMYGIRNIFSRVLCPMWNLGGLSFSWYSVYHTSSIFAYLCLVNPLTYAYEGCRAATLQPTIALPYWYCIIALLLFTTLFATLAIKNLQKRLDCL